MHLFSKTIITSLLLLTQVYALMAGSASETIKIISNSPITAGEKLKVEIIVPASKEKIEYQFNGESHNIPDNLKIFKAFNNATRYAKIKTDNKSIFGKVVSVSKKYQSPVSIKVPDDDKAYYIWLRAKGSPFCLRKTVNRKWKELRWNWTRSKGYSWRLYGCYNKKQLGSSIAFMNQDIKSLTAIDCVLFTTDKNYKPLGQTLPNTFYWQTDSSSVGTHKMPVKININGESIERNITVKVLPATTVKKKAVITLSKTSLINIPLGKSACLPDKYEDFNIFNQAYRDFFSKDHLGIKFPEETKFVALKCKKYPNLPSEAKVPVGKKLAGLAFLHTEYWQGEVGQKIAFYRIKYSDSTSMDIMLREEFEIAGSLRSPNTKNAIQLFNASSKSIDFHVSLFVWKNPHPQKQIQSITFSNRLSRYSKEENKIIPLNVTSMSSQILLNITGIKTSNTVDILLAQQKNKSTKIQQQIFATLNFRGILGKINPYLFSTNETGIMNTDTPEFKDYSNKMSKIGCPMFRLHSGWQPAIIYPKGIKGPKLYKKLDDGIRNILKGHPERVIMICINKIPKYIDPLKKKDREHFAALCADLLRHFKKENIPVKYWEIYNEVYFKGVKKDRSLWKMYNLTAQKLKTIDPTIKIGGYAPCWPVLFGIKDFYQYCNKNIDFLSWHKYPTGSSKTPDNYVMNSTSSFGKDARAIRKMAQEITPGKKLEYALTEYNINWNWKPHDPRQANNKGAVWLASVLNHLINAKVDMALTWHSRSGGTFGLLSNKNKIRPVAQLLYLCNRYLKTDYVVSKSSNKSLECLGFIEQGKHVGILLINKSSQARQVKISALNLPVLPINPFEGNALEYTIGAQGMTRGKSNINTSMSLIIKPYELKMLIAPLKD